MTDQVSVRRSSQHRSVDAAALLPPVPRRASTRRPNPVGVRQPAQPAGRMRSRTAPSAQLTASKRPPQVHWSMAAASRDARLRQVNKERAQLQQTRLLGCEEDPELFFDDGPEAQRRAQRICWDCPVRRRCLDAALRLEVNGSTSRGFRVSTYSAGTVGGITSQVRNRLVRRRRQEAGYVKGSYRQAPEKETATTSRRSAPASSTYTERRSA